MASKEEVEWVILGMPKGSKPRAGKTYRVISERKGTFEGKAIRRREEWLDLLITSGKARAVLAYNEREAGDEVTVRASQCLLVPIDGRKKKQ